LSSCNFYRPSSDTNRRIGLIAGWGEYPVVVADALRRRDYHVFCVGIAGHADRALEDRCYQYQEAGLARMGAHLRFFRRHGIHTATMAGKIHKLLLFQRGFMLRHLPDWRCARAFFPHFVTGRKSRNDDALLSAAVAGYAKGGIEIVPATQLIPELLVKQGIFAGRGCGLSSGQRRDIEFGWNLAKKMGDLDIGQTVAVKGQAVLAVEAVEGTDQCIRRAGMLCPAGNFTVVKVAKPHQDMRFDVPTIGIGTLQTLHQSGGTVLAVEADQTILIDQPRVARFAAENGLTVVAVRNGKIERDLLEVA
jgi:DUF1009 family protein